MKTTFIVQPYEKTPRGELRPRQPVEAKDAHQCRRLAVQLKAVTAGVIAYSREADPDLGEYGEAVILLSLGEVPVTEEGVAA